MAIDRIYGTDTGKQAFAKTDSNFQAHEEAINENKTNIDTVSDNMEQIADKGYVNTKVVNNLDDALENGKYKIIISGHSIIAAGTYLVDTTKYDATASSQILRNVNANGANTTYIRLYRAGVETVRLLATTDKVDITVTPASGMTKVYDNSYRINNVVYINLGIRKTDSTPFATNSQILVGTVPSGNTPLVNPSVANLQGMVDSTNGIGIGNVSILTGGQIYATNITSNVTIDRISGVYVCA